MLFHTHHIHFSQVDPEDNGLHDEVTAEQLEPEAITLEEGFDAEQLSSSWGSITSDLENDPEWFKSIEE